MGLGAQSEQGPSLAEKAQWQVSWARLRKRSFLGLGVRSQPCFDCNIQEGIKETYITKIYISDRLIGNTSSIPVCYKRVETLRHLKNTGCTASYIHCGVRHMQQRKQIGGPMLLFFAIKPPWQGCNICCFECTLRQQTWNYQVVLGTAGSSVLPPDQAKCSGCS